MEIFGFKIEPPDLFRKGRKVKLANLTMGQLQDGAQRGLEIQVDGDDLDANGVPKAQVDKKVVVKK
ncbi:MAG: hypothetical protein AAB550_04090 [Patescibacteria group bacterium]